MLLLGHSGLTFGLAVVLNAVSQKRISSAMEKEKETSSDRYSWFSLLENRIDIRFLLVGALLPDLIDKPIGFLLQEIFTSGRTIAHTLLFLIVLSTISIFFRRRRGGIILSILSFGVLTHLIFDQMWGSLRTLLWPVYGFAFSRVEVTTWISGWFNVLLHNPEVYITELLGGILLTWFAAFLYKRRSIIVFLKYGRAND